VDTAQKPPWSPARVAPRSVRAETTTRAASARPVHSSLRVGGLAALLQFLAVREVEVRTGTCRPMRRWLGGLFVSIAKLGGPRRGFRYGRVAGDTLIGTHNCYERTLVRLRQEQLCRFPQPVACAMTPAAVLISLDRTSVG